MKNRQFLLSIRRGISLSFTACLLSQCTTRPVVATSTQFGANVSGSSSSLVSKATVGYSRSELAYLPKGAGKKGGVVGSFDAESRWFKGNALSETLITGDAASGKTRPLSDHYSEFPDGEGLDYEVSENKIISTNTRSNLGIEAPGSDGAGPSLNFGFRRAVVAIFGSPRAKKNDPTATQVLPSTYADISIHASGLNGSRFSPDGIEENRHLVSEASGSRTVQRLATGRAASLLTQNKIVQEFVKEQVTPTE